MKRNWTRWGWLLCALVGLFAPAKSAAAGTPILRTTGSLTPASLGMPLSSVVCSTPRSCIAIGTPTYGSALSPVAVRTVDGGDRWASTHGPLGIKNLYALACASARTCVVSGGNPEGNGERGAVTRTVDGGESWALAPALPRGVGRLVGVSCPTKTFCMAVGVTTATTRAMAAVSNNAGQNWRIVPVPAGQESLTLVTCTSRRLCIAVGEIEASVGNPSGGSRIDIIRTANSGTTWTQSSLKSNPNAPAGIPNFTGLTCASATHCFMVGEATPPDGSSSGMIATSTNSGASWTFEAVPLGTSALSTISCGRLTWCAAAGGGFGARGGSSQDLLSTNDGGRVWTSRPVPSSATGLEGISCPSALSCIAVGFSYSATDPTAEPAAVVVSADGGLTWEPAS